MKKRKYYIVASILVTAFIFRNSLQSAAVSTDESSGFVRALLFILSRIGISAEYGAVEVFVRKAAHVTEFFVQGLLISRCFYGRYRNRVVYILFFGLLTACTDEFIQLFVEERAGMVVDIMIDFSGTVLVALVGATGRERR